VGFLLQKKIDVEVRCEPVHDLQRGDCPPSRRKRRRDCERSDLVAMGGGSENPALAVGVGRDRPMGGGRKITDAFCRGGRVS